MEAMVADSSLQHENALLIGQKRVLEMVATGAPLADILAELARFIEAQEEGLRCGILVVSDDGAHFRWGGGPSLPETYRQALDGVPITPPYLGPCGEAAHQGKAVVVPDIAKDDRWADAWRDLVLSCGLASCRSTPVFAPDGKVLASFAMYYDRPRDPRPAHPQLIEIAAHLAGIALERQRAETILRDRERQYRELLGALPAAVYTTDAAGRITYYNQAAVDLAGRRPTLGSDQWCVTWRLYWPDGTPMPHDQCPMAVALKENRPVRGEEAVAERPDGTRVPFIPYPTPLHDASDALVGAVNMLVDITERKAAEEALRASEERLSAELAAARQLQGISTELIREQGVEDLYDKLVEAAATIMRAEYASIQVLHPERGSGGELRLLAFRGFNPQAAKFWEWVRVDSESTCGVALRTGKRVVVPDVARCDFMAGTEDLETYLQTGIHAVQTTPLISRAGRLLGMISTHWREPHEPPEADLRRLDVLARQAADLIERAQADEMLRDLNARLEERIEERTRALETEMAERRKMEAALQQAQRLEAIGQLTGGVAHDFNNLLTVVVGQSEGIALAADGNDRVARMAAAIQRAAERGARLTGQLLAFSRRQTLRPAIVTLDRLMANIDDLVRRAAGETIAVEYSAAPVLWPTLVDPAQFESALINLVINARDAMPEGGRLVIDARNAAVAGSEAARLDLAPGDYVVVSVTDTGTGMPPHVREHAFEPFFTTKDVGKGTGLGLAQLYGFAKQSGGAAAIESTLGQGTTIALYLPRAAAAAEDKPASAAPAPAAGRGRTVLVVEDQPEVREVIEASLAGLGYRVLAAPDGVAARQMLASDVAIDLLLTDVVMPNGVSGIDLARAARRLRQDLRIVLVSGYPRDAQGRTGGVLDEFVFLEKPFRQAELADTIAAALEA